MSIQAIVYTSNTGFTARYAKLLGEKTGLPVYEAEVGEKALPKGTAIVYFGWIMASSVKGYKKAAARYDIRALCAVGLCDTGALMTEVRKATGLPAETPLFTLQGGMDYSRLRGINRFMISMLRKGMAAKKDRTEDEERMYILVRDGGDFLREENLNGVLEWLRIYK